MSTALPSTKTRELARQRFASLATPAGALGQLEELGVWLASCQGQCPPRPLEQVDLVVPAGDHGVTQHGVSAYPASVTEAMVRALVTGVAGVSVLAAQHKVRVATYDISVDADLSDLPAAVGSHKICRGSGSIDREDAITLEQARQGLAVGQQLAAERIAAGTDLLVVGDLGIGNTTIAATLIAATLGLDAQAVTGLGSGIDERARTRKAETIQRALDRYAAGATGVDRQPIKRLAALGSADFAVGVGLMVEAATKGVPVLLDGVISAAQALLAQEIAPGTRAWLAAGHRSPEPAQVPALESLGLEPILDLRMRLGEGSGALAALPLLRSAALLGREVALLEDLLGG